MSAPAIERVDSLSDVDWDHLDLNEHEFDLPCQLVKVPENAPCHDPAAWFVVFEGHCTGNSADMLVCEEHHQFIAQGGHGVCRVCRSPLIIKDFVLRTERIKP